MDRVEWPAWLAVGLGALTAIAGAVSAVLAMGWASGGGGLGAAVALVVLAFGATVALAGGGLAMFGWRAVQRGRVRGPAVVVGGHVGVVAAAVAWFFSTQGVSSVLPGLGYASVLLPVAGIVAGYRVGERLATERAEM